MTGHGATGRPPRKLGAIAVLSVAAIGVAAFLMGFYVLPSQGSPGQYPASGVWLRICRAAGFVKAPRADSRLVASSDFTSVVVPIAMLTVGTPEQIGHGATLALRCTVCHGALGMSGADAPNLGGQYGEVIYKELLDYQRGARSDAVMNAMASTLTEEDIRDLSHYFAYLPRRHDLRDLAAAPALVRVGDPMRNIPPCASCHGDHDGKWGAPDLSGEPRTYLRDQLTAFASGARRNDANAAMRSVARHVSAAEMNLVASYYAGASSPSRDLGDSP